MRGRKKMTSIQDDSNFVPLEIMQQASQEEAKLKAIKKDVVEQNKQDQLITDNTQINVKTEVIPDVNVWGIERSGFFNGREKWAKGFENQRV